MWSGGQQVPPASQPTVTPPRRPRGGGRAAQNKEVEDYKKDQKQNKIEGIRNSIREHEQAIQDLNAKLNDELPRSEGAQARQIDLKAEEIKSLADQTGYLQEKHNELLAKAASHESTAQQMRWRLFFDIQNWMWLSKRDILEKVQAAWEDACFSYMKCSNDMGRAIAGTGGQSRAQSGRTPRPYAGEKPSDYQFNMAEQTANETRRLVPESETNLRAQHAKIADATKQIESERSKLRNNVGEEKKTTEEKIARYQTRLEEVKKRLIDAGGNMEQSAATFIGA